MRVHRRSLWVSGFAVALALLVGPVSAQSLPAKPIRILVGFSAGGAMDLTARFVGAKLSESLGVPVVIENRIGAGGNLAAEVTANAAPDGTTLYLGGYTNAIAPNLFRKLGYDPVKDLTPIARVVTTLSVLLTHPSVPVRNVGDLVALAKAHPNQITYSSSGVGSASHLAGELLGSRANVKFVHVPYKGSPQQMMDLINGEVKFTFVVLSQGIPQITSGKVNAIAVTSPERSSFAPQLPTVAESGYPGYQQLQWYAVFGPARMPAPLVEQLNREIVKALRSPDLIKQLSDRGLDPAPSTAAELGELLKSEVAFYAKLLQDAGVKPD